MNGKPVTVLYALLAAAAVLPFLGMCSVSAEVPDDVMYRALEGKQIWERLEYISGKDNKTVQDEELARDLEEQFQEIVAEMNEHGIASPEQWEEDPDYWRMKNAPPTSTPDGCFCPQEYKAGFTPCGFLPSAHAGGSILYMMI